MQILVMLHSEQVSILAHPYGGESIFIYCHFCKICYTWEVNFKIDIYPYVYHLHIKRPHRLTVRTPGFHPGNRSSILRGVT